MENLNEITQTIALTMGVAWASGINLYATLLVLGFFANTGDIVLPPDLEIVGNPLVMTAAGLMYCVEFFADKVPGVDTGWDTIQTFIRIPAGALLAASAVGEVGPAVQVAAAIVGGGLTTVTHATKAGCRVIINTSPEPFTNWTASIGEDIAVVMGVWASLTHPWFFIAALVIFILLVVWMLPKIWRGIKKLGKFLAGLFSNRPDPHELKQLD